MSSYSVEEGIDLFKRVYSLLDHSMGGHIHIISEDCNMEDNWLEECEKESFEGCFACFQALKWLRQLNFLERVGFFYTYYSDYTSERVL